VDICGRESTAEIALSQQEVTSVQETPLVSPEQQTHPQKQGAAVREIIQTVALTLLIFLAVHFSIQPFRVDGPSMQPGLHTDELVVVNLLSYDFGSPQRGDVIVFHPPGDPGEQFVKRIIGVPGDTVTLTPTNVAVDGMVLHEPYISPIPSGAEQNTVGCLDFGARGSVQVVLQRDQYYVMGDNRLNSQDSRCFGVVSRQSIVGKAEVVLFPVNSIHWLPSYAAVFQGVKS
jgi:signal peptidase I